MALGFNPFLKDKARVIPKTRSKKYNRFRVFDDAPPEPKVQPKVQIEVKPKTVAEPPSTTLKLSENGFSLEPSQLVLSSVRKSEKGNSVIVRFFNPTEKELNARLHMARRSEEAWLVDLTGNRLDPLKLEKNQALSMPILPQALLCAEFLY